MNLDLSWMESDWTQALGWTFVHSIWQIALIGLALFVTLRFVPRRNANARYTISTLALWLIVCTTLATFILMLPTGGQMIYSANDILYVGSENPLTLTERIAAWLEVRMPMMLMIWAGGVAILMIRLLLSLGWVRHIKTTAMPKKEIQQTLNSILSRLQLKIKPLAASTPLVSSPMTIGHLKPLILFPIGILNQLSIKEVEAILTHELAHIVRKDYLSNLVQSFIETLFYYHPITWWISEVVRSERENRADDLAVAWCGDQLSYAKALITVQEMQVGQGPSLAIGFASRKGAMLARIKRILNVPYKNHNQMEKTVLLSLTTLCFLAFTLTSHTKADQVINENLPIETIVTLQEIESDSIPTKGNYRVHKKTDSQDISVEVEDGVIKQLTVDGKEVAPADFKGYDFQVNELFGNMRAPQSMNSFDFEILPMPEVLYDFKMPPMPEGLYEFEYNLEMPPIPEMNFQYLADGHEFHFEGQHPGEIKVYSKEMKDGKGKMMIFVDGDTIVQEINMGNWIDVQEEFIDKYKGKGNVDLYNEQKEAYRESLQLQRRELENQQNIIRYELQKRNEEMEKAHDIWQYEIRNNNEALEDNRRLLMEKYEIENNSPAVWQFRSHRLSLSDQMVKDGLVKPGAEIDVQLTPSRLKINGEKMSDEIHAKYLKLYEDQQGVELTGKSKVEFTTKSKQGL